MTYTADDIETLNEVLTGFPDVRELVDGIRGLGSVSYPIDSFATLSQRNCDDAAGSTIIATLGLAPAYYFPIASLRDLVAKLLALLRPVQPDRVSRPAGTPSPVLSAGSTLGSLPLLHGPAPARPPGAVAPAAGPSTVFLTETGPHARPKAEYSAPTPPAVVAPAPDQQ